MLRDKETKIEETTRDKVKIVERVGRKIEDIIANKDPWKHKDCGRPNCFICMTKTLREGNKNKDCTKRNINYEIKCLTCETIEKGRREEEAGDDVEKRKELEEKMKTPIYIGETSRSGYERGFEHLNNLATLSSKSVLLRHMVSEHEGNRMGYVCNKLQQDGV